MSGLELGPKRYRHLGAIETPEYRPLPWSKPDPKAQKKAARMSKLSDWGTVLGVLAGSAGLYLSIRAIFGRKKK